MTSKGIQYPSTEPDLFQYEDVYDGYDDASLSPALSTVKTLRYFKISNTSCNDTSSSPTVLVSYCNTMKNNEKTW